MACCISSARSAAELLYRTGQAQEILLRCMPQTVVESPPDAGTLEVRAQSRVPGLREGIQGRQKTSDESPSRTHSFPNPGSTGEGKT